MLMLLFSQKIKTVFMLRSTISENYNENIKRKIEMQHRANTTKHNLMETNENQRNITVEYKPVSVAKMNLSETLLSKFCY